MTDPGITLNIYNKPPKIEGNQIDNNNQNETNLNLKNDIPDKSSIYPTPSPSPNYLQSIDNTRNESVDTIENNQSSLPPVPPQYQRPQMQIYGQTRPVQPIMVIPNPQPVQPILRPIYRGPNNPYQGQRPVIIMQQDPRQLQGNNVNAQPIIIKEKKKDNTDKACCGFLAGCMTFLTTCCLISWCIGGGRRGRW